MQFLVSWASAESLPLMFANAFVSQLGSQAGTAGPPDAIYLTIGQLAPPLLVGTPEEVAQQAARFNGTVEVRPVARIVLSRERAAELGELLQTVIKQYDDTLVPDSLPTARVADAGGTR
jgi:hypothetical protein